MKAMWSMSITLVLWILFILNVLALQASRCVYRDHLVVITHGLMGASEDLSYLGGKLEKNGFVVLKSKSNERQGSLVGADVAAENLRKEIEAVKFAHPGLTKISFVGNSLGGIFARVIVKEIFNAVDKTCMGLKPVIFMTIATPHLGVRYYTYLDEQGIHVPLFVKKAISNILLKSGQHLFGTDSEVLNESLIYQIATDPAYLAPLRAFEKRRMYANVNSDFVVPLGTAAALDEDVVQAVRDKHRGKYGIVDVFSCPNEEIGKYKAMLSSERYRRWHSPEEEGYMNDMLQSLNSVCWEKVLVHFRGALPMAHNKICAISKYGAFIDKILGYDEGEFVMDHAAEWFIAAETCTASDSTS